MAKPGGHGCVSACLIEAPPLTPDDRVTIEIEESPKGRAIKDNR